MSQKLLSREEKELIADLTIKIKPFSLHGNAKSSCWNHIGHLHSISKSAIVDEDRYYCAPCLDAQQAAGDASHLSKVATFAPSTSTGTMALHLSMKHNIRDVSHDKTGKILSYLQKYDKCGQSACTSTHELNRDLVVWFCRDLIPFEAIAKKGMNGFFMKMFPGVSLPTPETLSGCALDDV